MKSSRGVTIIEVMIVIAIVCLVVALTLPPYLANQNNQRCEQLKSELGRVKDEVASEQRLKFGQSVDPQLLVAAGLALTIDEGGQVLCPHGAVIDIGSVDMPPFYYCVSGDPNHNCLALRLKIQAAKVVLADHDNLRWNDPITIGQLQTAGLPLSASNQGRVVCPETGLISINGPGQVPTCSKHY